MDIKEILSVNKLHDDDIVKIVKPYYPGFERSLVVKAKNEDNYGIKFIPAVEKLIIARLSHKPYAPVSARKRRIRYTLRFDTTKTKLARVHRAIRAHGYTISTGMNRIMDYFLAHEDIL